MIENDILRLIGALTVRQIQARIRTGKVSPGTNKAGTTLFDRGKLYRSIKSRAGKNEVVISAGEKDVPYARIQHEGGTIKPKNAKYLAIPLTPQAKLHNPKDYPGETFIAKGVIFLKNEGAIQPLYVLKKQVVIPERRYMFIDDQGREDMKKQVMAWIRAKLQENANVV